MKRPDLAQVPVFFHKYVNLVQSDDPDTFLPEVSNETSRFLAAIPEDRWDYRYAEGKWSIKEMVQHLIDSERIFSYRALCISRGETASLPGFDENLYADGSHAAARTKAALLQELEVVQQATTLLFQSFDEEQLERFGISNNKSIQVLAIGFLTAGHKLHHKNILQDRYL